MADSNSSPEDSQDNLSEIIDNGETCGITHNRDCVHSTKSIVTEEKMRRKLQFFFMNPIEKWRAKRRFPYKFIIQVIKIFLVTIQLCLFASSRYNHVTYTWDNKIAFSHLFLKDWDPVREVNAYPPSAGPLAIYKEEDVYETIDYALKGYANVEKAVGSYSYDNEDNIMTDAVLCIYEYKKGIIYGFNDSYIFDGGIVEKCVNISQNTSSPTHSKIYLEENNVNINFSVLINMELKFSLKTVNFKSAGRITPPNCYRFDIVIMFDNENRDGQIILSLDAEPIRLTCKGQKDYTMISSNRLYNSLRSLLNYLVIVTCIASCVLCTRTIWRAQKLRKVTENFFLIHFNRPLSSEDKLKFVNFWYIMIAINDVLIIIGSSIKEQIEREEFASDQWNVCSLFLGIGNMLVWFGVLRYLGFFKTYNVVILTLQKCAPQVARFLVCALLIYAGFTFSGWLILGPYHLKFRSISMTSECLFSLINGDDMFATFSIMSTKSSLLWWFSRIYLYSFISLFIYTILSLFICVIMDAYETIKLYYLEGFPKSDLEEFMGCTNFDEVSSGIFRSNSNESLAGILKHMCCCKHVHKSYSSLSTSTVGGLDQQNTSNTV